MSVQVLGIELGRGEMAPLDLTLIPADGEGR